MKIYKNTKKRCCRASHHTPSIPYSSRHEIWPAELDAQRGKNVCKEDDLFIETIQ